MQQPQHVYRVGSAGPSEKVTLGDGSSLDVAGKGTVYMDMVLINGSRRGRALKKVLYVPNLATTRSACQERVKQESRSFSMTSAVSL